MHFQFCREFRIHSLRWTSGAVLITLLLSASSLFAQETSQSKPVVGRALGPFEFTGDLRSLPKSDPRAHHEPGLLHGPLLPARSAIGPVRAPLDELIEPQSMLLPSIASPLVGFDGIPGGNPPDTNGVVGPNHFVQTINISYEIWDKTGNSLAGPTDIRNLFSAGTPTGTPCDNGFVSDPVALYDPLADRFLITILAFAGFQAPPAPPRTPVPPFYECIAISKTGDPVNGGFFKYALLAHNTILNDFPKLGVWPDAYYMTANMGGCCGGGSFVRAWALDRNSILSGGALNEQHFDIQSGFNSVLPENLEGASPPAGEPNVFAAIDFNNNNSVFLWNFHVDWAVPSNSTFGQGAGHTPDNTVTVAAYTHLSAAIPQPGTSVVSLDPLGDRLNYPAQYRTISGTESLWLDHAVDTGSNVSGVRWYEIRSPSSSPSVFQQGTWNNSGDGVDRWMGGIGADQFGDMMVGYNVSNSSSVSPGIRYAGRLITDPAGTLAQGEATLIAGSGNILNCSPKSPATTCTGRWGDYSGMSVDPVDDCTFWFTGEYVTGGSNNTRIGAITLPSCSADLSVTKSAPATVDAGTNLTYTITVTNNGPVTAQLVTLTDTLPAGVSLVSSPASCGGFPTLTCNLGTIANGVTVTLTVVVSVPANYLSSRSVATAVLTNTASVTASEPDPNLSNNTATANTTVVAVADLSITKGAAPNPVDAGTPLTYTIAVTNFGPSDSTGTTVTDTLPAGVNFASSSVSCVGAPLICSLGTIPANSQESFTITVNIPANYLSSRFEKTAVITNTATAAPGAGVTDPNLVNNTASVNTTVIQVADVGVAVSEAPNPVHQGGTVTYTMTFSNAGPSDAPFAQVLQYFPAGFVFAGSSLGTCKAGTKDVLCQFGPDTTVGYMHTFTVTYKVPAKFLGTSTSKTVISQIGVSSQAIDPDPADSTNFVTTTVIK